MPSKLMPALFLSHGAPTLVLEDCPARDFLAALADDLPRPAAIIVCSAHCEAPAPRIGAARLPETIHDFRGFPEALYRMQYPAPGDPALARRVEDLLTLAGFDAKTDSMIGLDHGIWNPLTLIWPDADIPVLPLSITPSESPDFHFRLGHALAPLRAEGIMLIGSGSITHNLRRFFSGGYALNAPEEPFARQFADWIGAQLTAGDYDAVLAGPDRWPLGRENHPTDDHILPLFFAMGAGAPDRRGAVLHASTNYGVLAMDVLAFGACSPGAITRSARHNLAVWRKGTYSEPRNGCTKHHRPNGIMAGSQFQSRRR